MSRQPKLCPKSHIPGYSDGLYDLGVIAPLPDTRQGFCEERREQRVFRVKRKHVLKACDRCRVKKTKCDGKQPCNRCSAYNHPCLFRERKATQTKVYSRGFVEMLESHHSLVVKALQKLYKHCVNKEGFPGEPLAETADGHPLTHAILDRLDLINQAEENPDEPEEDTDDLHYLRLLSTSTDSSATSDPSPEPATPPDPTTLTNCNQLNAPPGPAGPWKWEYPPEQYPNYPDNGYQGMMSRPPLGPGPGPAVLPHNAAAVAAHPPPSGPDNSYLYYLDDSGGETQMKSRLQPAVGVMPGPSPHPHPHSHPPAAATPGLPVDMLGDYHLPLQEQPLYSGLTPGWNFPTGQ